MNNALPASVAFDGADLRIIDHDGQPWLSAADLARALGYADTSAVTRIHARHEDEFSGGMTHSVNLTVRDPDGELRGRDVRIFSPRGCHLIAMFAHTPRAAAFRRWVLDVLEGLAAPEPDPPMLPLPAPEADLLRGMLEAVMCQFCGTSPTEQQLRDLRDGVAGVAKDLRSARIFAQHAEEKLQKLITQPVAAAAPQPPVALPAAMPRRSRRPRKVPQAQRAMRPETAADLEKLRKELDDRPKG